MVKEKLAKCVAVPVLAFSALLSAGITNVHAAEKPSLKQSSNEQTDKVSKLNLQQLKEYNDLKKQGLNVSISESDNGTLFINAYESSPVTYKKTKKPGEFSAQIVVGEQTFNIKQSAYYGYSRVCGITGKIKVEYRGKQ